MPQPDLRTREGADEFLTYRAPDQERADAHHHVNQCFRDLLAEIWDWIPEGPGKTVLVRDLNRARMSANSAIANDGA